MTVSTPASFKGAPYPRTASVVSAEKGSSLSISGTRRGQATWTSSTPASSACTSSRSRLHPAIVAPGYAVHLVRRLLPLALTVAVAFVAPGPGQAAEFSLTMDDGVPIDAGLVVPAGAPPAGGWPVVMMFHGLGGSHKGLVAGLGPAYLAKGYAVFAPDARGHGTSGGYVSLDGPREIADIRAEFQWLAARPEISGTQIRALGVSPGGGAAGEPI